MKTVSIEKRVYALLLDGIFLSILFTLLSSLIDFNSYKIDSFVLFNREWVVSYSIRFIVFFVYFITFDVFGHGSSFGKQIMKLQIVNCDDTKASTSKLIYRTILKSFLLFTFLMPILLLHYLLKKEVYYDKILKISVKKI